MILAGERVIQETLLWNDEKAMTIPMRSKEEAHDYRYFPEPDLVPFTIEKQAIEDVRKSLPELPAEKLERLQKQYGVSTYDGAIIIQDPELAAFFEECAKHSKEIKKICNWIIGPVLQELNNRKIKASQLPLKPQDLVAVIQKLDEGVLNNLSAKETLKFVIETGKSTDNVIRGKGLAQVSDDSALEKIIDEVLKENPGVVEQIKHGKDSAAGFLVGQAMKKSQGKGNPKKFGEILKRRL